ncbi:Permease of the drug/metabolite transporter (DMT) superfamily [hydrothermal vent metagenome]|uniref:Permease of the drug/metabolite transporter (DMT) superfamily n=1 Tax=hydrothermal vent metagenome TaxID=652676 RepID=A0A3B1BJY0_9ZZZZ
MSVPVAFIGIILIWSTTPLAIKWSAEDVGFLFGVASRMMLGTMLCIILMTLLGRKLSFNRAALHVYLAGGVGVFGAMLCVYWAAQYISSGLISVLFGLTPIVTGLIAAVFLGEKAFTLSRLMGVTLGIIGLAVIFSQRINLGEHLILGVIGVLSAVLMHSISGVWVKSLGINMSALEVTTGSLLFSAPLYFLVWWIFDGQFPEAISERALGGIVYLGTFGSVLGFILYFYVLKHIEASRVALVTLITPVLALLLGHQLNNEVLNLEVWLGSGCILSGMLLYQWGSRLDAIYSS